MRLMTTTFIAILLCSKLVLSRHICSEQEKVEYRHHCHLMDLASTDYEKLSTALRLWAEDLGLIIPNIFGVELPRTTLRNLRSSKKFPTILSHGMGDSCFNSGMQSITHRVSSLTDQYSTCIPTGDNLHDDTINGYFKSMLDNVDVFAEKIRSDPNLKNGFNAIGFSQGSNIIRAYIAKYNEPPVKTFISVNGVNGGISAVPYCIPSLSSSSHEEYYTISLSICDALMEMASHRAYSEFSQVKLPNFLLSRFLISDFLF